MRRGRGHGLPVPGSRGSPEESDPADPAPAVSRRQVLGGLGLAGAGAALGGVAGVAGGAAIGGSAGAAAAPLSSSTVPFYGRHQAGIITPVQDRLVFATFDVVDGTDADGLRGLLARWGDAAAKLATGQLVGEDDDPEAPPLDTGEAVGSPVSNLTVTIGYGPSLFDSRFGLASKRPAQLVDLPALPNEDLDPAYTGGDLCIQACSGDPLVAFHAVRNLARLGTGVVALSWMELGFGKTSTTSTAEATPRNLLGFKDGTRNVKAQDTDLVDRYVWVGRESDQAWLHGGSYLVARRIRIFIENWDRAFLGDQQKVIGRAKTNGAPLSGGTEFTTPDFGAQNDQGQPVIPAHAHIRLASHEENGGLRLLRRGYSYTDGIDPVLGTLLGGLFFIAFMKDPNQFITLQQKLGTDDALNEYVQHTGSALFACPPGIAPGEHWGDELFSTGA
jgi:deferrochelatase/peroxidase EfeB